ncbi:MAG: hypothetical protein IE918_09200 [Campylobacterales bacterium]|nr:hypothetical protein [Campylobacterales bacterium]
MITMDEFIAYCRASFEALEKDFSRDAETEARCWYSEDIAKDGELMKIVAEKLAQLCD